jgi:hypothetical protein
MEQVLQRPRRPIELPDHHHVAVTQVVQQAI